MGGFVYEERRRYARLSVGREYTAHFKLKGQEYVAVLMTDLSAGGCCFQVPARDSQAFEKGGTIARFYFDHVALPPVPLQGEIVRVLGRVPGKSEGYVLVGVVFRNMNLHVTDQIDAHVMDKLNGH